MERLGNFAARTFLVWIVLFGLLAWWHPPLFAPVKTYIRPLLGLIMFGMGMTLVPADFTRVLSSPRAVALGVAGQFVIMPLAGYVIAHGLGLPWELAVGTILVGVCPSGTASNVVAYLARADVALSVTVTAVNTLLAPVLTPLLLKLLAGQHVQVEGGKMFAEILLVVVAPVLAGLVLNRYVPAVSRRLAPAAPLISVVGIVLIVSFIIGANSTKLSQFSALLVLSVALHNACGYAGGYWLGRFARLPEEQCRALACEIGIQNSALDIELATRFYSHVPAMTLPGAFFSVWQNLTGPILAAWWSRRPTRRGAPESEI